MKKLKLDPKVILRLGLGLVVLIFGVQKFALYTDNLQIAQIWGLPNPMFWVILIGVLELVGGSLLLLNKFTKPVTGAAAVLLIPITLITYIFGNQFVVENIGLFAGFVALYLLFKK